MRRRARFSLRLIAPTDDGLPQLLSVTVDEQGRFVSALGELSQFHCTQSAKPDFASVIWLNEYVRWFRVANQAPD